MDFCVSLATRVMLDEINKEVGVAASKNVVLSPLSLNLILNIVASGSAGKSLDQFLDFLGYKTIDDLNDKSSLIMSLLASSSSSSEITRNDHTNDVVRPPTPSPLMPNYNNPYQQSPWMRSPLYYPLTPDGLYRQSPWMRPPPYHALTPDYNGPYEQGPWMQPPSYRTLKPDYNSLYGQGLSMQPPPPSYRALAPDYNSPYEQGRYKLRKTGAEEKEPLFAFVNALWVDLAYLLKPSFQDITKTIYKAQLKNVDFKNKVIIISFFFSF